MNNGRAIGRLEGVLSHRGRRAGGEGGRCGGRRDEEPRPQQVKGQKDGRKGRDGKVGGGGEEGGGYFMNYCFVFSFFFLLHFESRNLSRFFFSFA